MITPGWCHTMARYNTWQNTNLIGAAATLDDAARRADRGAFFGSISGTLSHILWGDLIWMSRFDGGEPPPKAGFAETATAFDDWPRYRETRSATDGRIETWAARLEPDQLNGDLSWYSAALGGDLTRPREICVMHLFNHQIHHRGQVHAMLTAAGARPGDTDLPFMPDAV